MVLSNILTSGERSTGKQKAISDFIYEESQLPCIPPDRPDLHDLNNSIQALMAVFPDVGIEVFREMLIHFSGESRLELVSDALLKAKIEWTKGRWRPLATQGKPAPVFTRADGFRSDEYKEAARTVASDEFKGFSKGAIDAVLAEHNYSYLDARATLEAAANKSWRYTLSGLFYRRKRLIADDPCSHPLIVWKTKPDRTPYATIKASGSAELDRELFNTIIKPINDREKLQQEDRDCKLAIAVNEREARDTSCIYECECCYGDMTFEELCHCTEGKHMICNDCVQASVKEAVFGQGWARVIDPARGTLRCMAADGSDCPGVVPPDQLYRAMLRDSAGAGIMLKLDQRLAQNNLLESQLPLHRCPFCDYAETEEIHLGMYENKLLLKEDWIYCTVILWIGIFTIGLTISGSILSISLGSLAYFGCTWDQWLEAWQEATLAHSRRRRGLKFTCKDPSCLKPSCLSCNAFWNEFHICNESSLVALRTQIEQAMSMAIKRVCPRCNTSFVKNSGCNKLACPCGYKMCYICRADLTDEGYRHFCDHFRPQGDGTKCTQCPKCNLWEKENTELVLSQAKAEAEKSWKNKEKKDITDKEKTYLRTGAVGARERLSVGRLLATHGIFISRQQFVDILVASMFQ